MYHRILQHVTSLILCCLGFQYETAMCCENPEGVQPGSEEAEVPPSGYENPSPIQQVAYHMVNRRYSEFLNLQTRLEEKTEVRKLIKGRKDLDSFTQKINLTMAYKQTWFKSWPLLKFSLINVWYLS